MKKQRRSSEHIRLEEIRKRESNGKNMVFLGMFENIQERAKYFRSQCLISLKDFSDGQILEKSKTIKILEDDYNKITDWVTELFKMIPPDYQYTEQTLLEAKKVKNDVFELKRQYFETLSFEIKSRNLGGDKIKNPSVLKLEVPKFEGYSSSLDFYTFKSEFEKLISPQIQTKFLPDYLKSNYLKGQAYEITKEIHHIDLIWERLKCSFGNVDILLNNKLHEVTKYGPLWKIKNDEKLVQILTKIINGMKELVSLAEKHNIEGNSLSPQ